MQDGEDRGMRLSNEEKRDEIVRQLSDTEIGFVQADIEVKANDGFELPLDLIPELGVAFGSLQEAFRTVAGTASVPTLLHAKDALGNTLDPSVLMRFKDGTGSLGAFRDAEGLHQARFSVANPGTPAAGTAVPFDPTMLFMAMALHQISKKLDAIQETQEEMFEYMRQKDKAALRGNGRTLTDIFNGYRYNWDNEIWRKNAHMKVEDIKQESDKDIVHLRAQIESKLNRKEFVEFRFAVDKRLEEVLDRLKEYQIAVYNYSFASFLEPLLSENYGKDYLAAVADKISDRSFHYRKLYTMCYNVIEDNARSSADTVMLGGLSLAGKKLGEAVSATSVGDHTRLDEVLEDVGESIGEFNGIQSGRLVEKLHQAKSPNVLPFKESLDAVNCLYNEPMRLLADSNSVYLMPVQEERED